MSGSIQPKSKKSLGDGELPMEVSVVGYQHEIKWYADFYGVTDRTVKRWKKLGRECGEMPPLDDVEAFVRWWTVRKKHKVPDNILAKLPSKPAEEDTHPLASVDLSRIEEVSDMGLSTMRRVVALKAQDVTKAYADGNKIEIDRCVKDLDSATKTLRMLEKTHADLAKAGGDLVSKKQVRAELAPMLGRLGASVLESMVKAVCKASPQVDRAEALALCVPERDECFRVVRGELVS